MPIRGDENLNFTAEEAADWMNPPQFWPRPPFPPQDADQGLPLGMLVAVALLVLFFLGWVAERSHPRGTSVAQFQQMRTPSAAARRPRRVGASRQVRARTIQRSDPPKYLSALGPYRAAPQRSVEVSTVSYPAPVWVPRADPHPIAAPDVLHCRLFWEIENQLRRNTMGMTERRIYARLCTQVRLPGPVWREGAELASFRPAPPPIAQLPGYAPQMMQQRIYELGRRNSAERWIKNFGNRLPAASRRIERR